MSRISSVFVFLFFLIFLAVGLGLLGFGARGWWKSNQASDWPTTQGTLLERDIIDDSDSDGGTTYRVKVRYAYTVAGRHLESERLAYGYAGSSGRESHQAIYDKLTRGESVRVRYNPEDPAEAVLAYGLNNSTLMLMVFGVVWTMFTVGLIVLTRIGTAVDTQLIERLIVQ